MEGKQKLPEEWPSYIPSDYVLGLNGSLMVPVGMELPAPWDLPSRVFRFPITVGAAAEDGTRRFGLMHPLLGDHPFVRRVEAELGVTLDPEGTPNEHGFTKAHTALWWHAVDLVSSGHWRDLLETRQFTTSEDIAGAVAYGLDYSSYEDKRARGHITTSEARIIMGEIGYAEPAERLPILRQLSEPSACASEKGTVRWPINNGGGMDAGSRAWSRIFGIEAGWLKHDAAGFLQWTTLGRDAYAAGDDLTFTQQKTGQGAFAF
jgi:hypothetical protein